MLYTVLEDKQLVQVTHSVLIDLKKSYICCNDPPDSWSNHRYVIQRITDMRLPTTIFMCKELDNLLNKLIIKILT